MKYYNFIKYLFVILLCYILTSCTDNSINIRKVDGFPFALDIFPFEESEDDILKYAYILRIIGDKIIVTERKSDTILTFLDKESLNFLYSKISKGKGPNEILLPGRLQVKGDTLFLLDQVRKQLHQYDINKLSKQNPLLPERIYNIPLTGVVDVKYIDANSLIVSGFVDDGLVCILDSTGIIKEVIGNIPEGCPPGYTNTGYFNASNIFHIEMFPDNNSFIISSMFSDKLQIFNLNSKESFNIIGPDYTIPKFNLRNNYFIIDDDCKFGYYDIVLTENYIYGLYSGFSQTEMKKVKVAPSSIFVFKHNGKPVGRFNLDRDIKAFDVDEKNGVFYTVQLNPQNKIFKYKYEIH